jgi:hypothetical protein
MKSISCALITFLLPVLALAANPEKLYSNTYDGRFGNVGDWNVSFFRNGTDLVSFDWNTKKERSYQCDLPEAKQFYAYQLSEQDSLYFVKRGDLSVTDGWVVDLEGSCLKVSDLVKDFPADNTQRKIFYSARLKQLVVTSNDYRVSPGDGRILVFIEPKSKTIVRKVPGVFSPGLFAEQANNTAVTIIGEGRYLNFYNLETFTLESSIDFGKTYISELYLKESLQLGIKNQYLISGAEQHKTFLGVYDKTTNQIIKKFGNDCYEVEFNLDNNLALCYDTPPGGPRTYYTQDLTTGEYTEIWGGLYYRPILSAKNSLIIANKQNGRYSLYDIKTKQTTEVSTEANASTFFFLDKEEKNLISVSTNWSGKVEIEKFLLSDPSKTTLLYKLEIPEDDDYGRILFNAEKGKLFVPLKNGGAYYLDIK